MNTWKATQFLGVVGAMFLSTYAKANPLYVDASVTQSGNGLTWSAAKKTIQEAVTIAGNESVIRVAQGTYFPASQFDVITLKLRVRIEGGYRGNNAQQLDPDERDIDTFVTYLSGDFSGNDWDTSNPNRFNDNAELVVLAPTTCTPPQFSTVPENVNLDGVTVKGAYSDFFGAGIWVVGPGSQPVFRNVTITGNYSGTGGAGVSVDADTSPVFRRCRFVDNHADWGGAIAADGATLLTVLDSTFQNNTASSNGGAIYAALVEEMSVFSCTFENNSATTSSGAGGAIYYIGASAVTPNVAIIANSKFIENDVNNGAGGGLYVRLKDENVFVKNCTFSANSASTGGGATFLGVGGFNGSATVENSIFWDNIGATNPEIELISGSLDVSYSNVEGGWPGSGGNNIGGSTADNPLFDSDYRLQCGSPCINRGSDTLVADDDEDVDEDQNDTEVAPDRDLNTRKVGTVDMGAYEVLADGNDCPADITDDGVVGVPDLLALINNWDACDPYPTACPADLAPTPIVCGRADGTVGVPDLLVLINAWGPCTAGPGGGGVPTSISDCWNIYCDGLTGEAWQNCVTKCTETVCAEYPEECD